MHTATRFATPPFQSHWPLNKTMSDCEITVPMNETATNFGPKARKRAITLTGRWIIGSGLHRIGSRDRAVPRGARLHGSFLSLAIDGDEAERGAVTVGPF